MRTLSHECTVPCKGSPPGRPSSHSGACHLPKETVFIPHRAGACTQFPTQDAQRPLCKGPPAALQTPAPESRGDLSFPSMNAPPCSSAQGSPALHFPFWLFSTNLTSIWQMPQFLYSPSPCTLTSTERGRHIRGVQESLTPWRCSQPVISC